MQSPLRNRPFSTPSKCNTFIDDTLEANTTVPGTQKRLKYIYGLRRGRYNSVNFIVRIGSVWEHNLVFDRLIWFKLLIFKDVFVICRTQGIVLEIHVNTVLLRSKLTLILK